MIKCGQGWCIYFVFSKGQILFGGKTTIKKNCSDSNKKFLPSYGVYIQLLQYSRACDYYQDSLDRGLLQTRKQLNHGFLVEKLKSSHQKGFTVSQTTIKKNCSDSNKKFSDTDIIKLFEFLIDTILLKMVNKFNRQSAFMNCALFANISLFV
jgi:hypothetical protein